MSEERIMIPLLNNKIITFKGSNIYFDDNTYIDTILDEDHAGILRHENTDIISLIDITTKCIYVENPTYNDINDYINQIATQSKFVLNSFSEKNPIVISFGLLLSGKRKTKIKQIVEVDAVANLSQFKRRDYRVKSTSSRKDILAYYKIVNKVCDKYPFIYFTLKRFSSCFTRAELLDKIVDATISLESLMTTSSELKFKFSLFNAFISETLPPNRNKAFELFQKLYDCRSAIVHGTIDSGKSKKKFIEIESEWDEVVRLMKASINYYLLFLYENEHNKWNEHLEKLIFGIDKKYYDIQHEKGIDNVQG